MRTQEAAIKARAVTFRPRPSTGPRPEHSEGAGGGCPQWPGESPPQAPRLRWPRACLWGPVPPEEKKQRRRQAPPHGAPASRELPAVSGTGSPSRRGEASCHPCQAALLLRRRPLEPSTKTSTAPSGPAGWAGPGRGPGASRTKAPVWRAAAQSPGPDLGPSPPSPERRDTEDAPKRREVPVGPTGTSWALEGARRRAHCSPTPTPQEGCWPPSSSPAATADDWRQATPPGAFGWGAG